MTNGRAWLRASVHVLAALPLLGFAYAVLGPGLGPDPVGLIIRRTGDVALVLLHLSLVPGAVRHVTGSSALVPLRRALGLYAFGYAALHLLSHVLLGYGGQIGLLLSTLGQNRYALVGLGTFLVMVPLAITSTVGWQRRLGRRWRQLHRLAYLAVLLDVWHYAWVYKELRPLPVLAMVAVLVLLAARLLRDGRRAPSPVP